MSYEVKVKPGVGGFSFQPSHAMLDPKKKRKVDEIKLTFPQIETKESKESVRGKQLYKSGSVSVRKRNVKKERRKSIEVSSPRRNKDTFFIDIDITRAAVGSNVPLPYKVSAAYLKADMEGSTEKSEVDFFLLRDSIKEKCHLIKQLRVLDDALRVCLSQQSRCLTVNFLDGEEFEAAAICREMDQSSASELYQLINRSLDLEIKGVFTDHGQWVSIGEFLENIRLLMDKNPSVKKMMQKPHELLEGRLKERLKKSAKKKRRTKVLVKGKSREKTKMDADTLPAFASDFPKKERHIIRYLQRACLEGSQCGAIDPVTLLTVYPDFVETERFFQLVNLLLKEPDSVVSPVQKCRLLNLCRTWMTRGYHLSLSKEEKYGTYVKIDLNLSGEKRNCGLYAKYMEIIEIGQDSIDPRVVELAEVLAFHVTCLHADLKNLLIASTKGIQRNRPEEETPKSQESNEELASCGAEDLSFLEIINQMTLTEKEKNLVYLLQQTFLGGSKPKSMDPQTLLIVYPHFANTQKFFTYIALFLNEPCHIVFPDQKCRLLNLCRAWISKRYHFDRSHVEEQLMGIWPIVQIGLKSKNGKVVDAAHELSFYMSRIFLDQKEHLLVKGMGSIFWEGKDLSEVSKRDEIKSLGGMDLRRLEINSAKSPEVEKSAPLTPLPRRKKTSSRVKDTSRQILQKKMTKSGNSIVTRVSARKMRSDEGGTLKIIASESALDIGAANQRRRATSIGENDCSLHLLHSNTEIKKKKLKREVDLVASDCFQISRAKILDVPLYEFFLKRGQTVYLRACTDYFDRLSNFLKESILLPAKMLEKEHVEKKTADLKKAAGLAAKRISFWIEVADQLVKKGDFFSGMSVVSSLGSVEIARLISQESLSKVSWQKWKDLDSCFSPCQDFKALKGKVEKFAFSIPYIGLLTKQLTSANENAEYLENKNLNMDKFEILDNLLSGYWENLEQLQEAFYKDASVGAVELHTNLKALLENIDFAGDEDQNWELSKLLKP